MNTILSLTPEELKNWLGLAGEPGFRSGQLLEWIYRQQVESFDAMTNIAKGLRSKLEAQFSLSPLELVRQQEAGDGQTTKFLWRLHDGLLVESVLIRSGDRRTVCVSSQVGCPANCAFCASGKQGFKRNLTVGEIVAQVWVINRLLEERVSHVVFMGMGEPLLNYEAVVKAIRILVAPNQMGIGQRRITVSTVGIIEGIQHLSSEGLQVNLVLSLHAPNQRLRKKVIPTAREYPLEDLLGAMDGYARRTKRNITYEYILMAGLNDQEEHADELADLVGRRQASVNLIPYNPVEGLRLRRPSGAQVAAFRAVLDRRNIVNTCRYTKGDDIAAACGQLALQE